MANEFLKRLEDPKGVQGRPTRAKRRNLRIKGLMKELLEAAKAGDFQLESKTQLKVHQVCEVGESGWGFREILLIICVARLLDPQYSPTSNFYRCNPRAIYEGPIRDVLREAGIPHRKSGALNVAKAANRIDEEWAAQRRPPEIAKAVVELAQWVENASSSEVKTLTISLLAELLKKASESAAYSIEVSKETDISYLARLCWEMVDKVPDAGNTPQRIVGLLLETYHEYIGSNVKVAGHEERASTTSTTSKKPADILEESADGRVLAVYEITVKLFDDQRASDSQEAVQAFMNSTNQRISEVLVVCRNEDVHPSAIRAANGTLYVAALTYRGLVYRFLNIYCWVESALSRLGVDARAKFYARLNDYMSMPNTSPKVKRFWKQLHEKGIPET